MKAERLQLEIMEMKKRFPKFTIISLQSGILAFRGHLRPRKQTYEILVVLPPTYPHEAPRVYPISPKIMTTKHQFTNGALCYHLGQEWSPNYTVCVSIGWIAHWFASYECYQETGYWPGSEA